MAGVRRAQITLAFLAIAGALAAGCGGGGSLPTAPAGTDVTVTAFDIGIRETTLPPVKAGSVSIFYRDAGTSHTLKIKDASGKDMGLFLHVSHKNASDLGTVDLKPGEYTVYCSIATHFDLMHRTLTVQ